MGKGDRKSEKGKRFRHSHGKTRPRKKGRLLSSRKKFEAKSKPLEHKKHVKPEPEVVKPAAVFEPKVEEVKIKEPIVTEIKEEVKLPEIIEESVSDVPEIVKVSVEEKTKPKESEIDSPKIKDKKETTTSDAPKKRGRPKKKKEE